MKSTPRALLLWLGASVATACNLSGGIDLPDRSDNSGGDATTDGGLSDDGGLGDAGSEDGFPAHPAGGAGPLDCDSDVGGGGVAGGGGDACSDPR